MVDKEDPKKFTCAIIPKNSSKVIRYLTEIEKQNNLDVEIFCKPI